MKLVVKYVRAYWWGFLWNTWKIRLRPHKYVFVLLNKLILAANTIFSNPEIANLWKNRQKWVSFETPLQYIVTYLESKQDSQVT